MFISVYILWPGNLLIILYQLTMFGAPSCNSFWDILITNFILTLKKGQNSTKGDNSYDTKQKIQVFYFLMRNLFMKYLKTLTYWVFFEQAHGHTNTYGKAQSNIPLQIFQSWGHKNFLTLYEIMNIKLWHFFGCETGYKGMHIQI